MRIITWIKRKLTGRHDAMTSEHADRIKRLPKEQARKELGSFLFELGVQHATEFVKDELRRKDSPFKGVPAEAVFHEMLALTFWIMDKDIAGGEKTLAAELHDLYIRTYKKPEGSPEDRIRALGDKYRRYELEWDDVTGHQDEFGLCVAQNIFGDYASQRTRERTFWIIQYAHAIADDCSPLKKMFRSKFKPEQSTSGNK